MCIQRVIQNAGICALPTCMFFITDRSMTFSRSSVFMRCSASSSRWPCALHFSSSVATYDFLRSLACCADTRLRSNLQHRCCDALATGLTLQEV